MTLVDTNVLLDLAKDDPNWAEWSVRQLESAASRGPLAVNPVICAELPVGCERIEEVGAFLAATAIGMEAVPLPGLLLAGKVFRRYRVQGGTRTGVLPDFLIGAHAAVAGLPLLTRDVARYRSDVPTAVLIAPPAS